MTSQRLRESQFGKTEDTFKKDGLGYSAEYDAGAGGGAIGALRFQGRAALMRAFRFDNQGELTDVFVEKRMLEKAPQSGDEGRKMYNEQERQRDKEEVSPVYALHLKKMPDGNFSIVNKFTSQDMQKWNSEFHPKPKTPKVQQK